MLHEAAGLFVKLIMPYFSITDQKGGYQQKQSYQRGTISIFPQHMVALPRHPHSYPAPAS